MRAKRALLISLDQYGGVATLRILLVPPHSPRSSLAAPPIPGGRPSNARHSVDSASPSLIRAGWVEILTGTASFLWSGGGEFEQVVRGA